MEEDQQSFAQRTLSKLEPTKKVEEHRTLAFIRKVASDETRPLKVRNKAEQLLARWSKLQRLPESSPKEQQAKKIKLQASLNRMVKFRKENQ